MMLDNQVNNAVEANVSLTRGVYFDSEGTAHYMRADQYDKDQHGDLDFCCADCWDNEEKKVRLKNPSKGFYQTIKQRYFDERLGETVVTSGRFFVPPRFTLMPNEKHACDLKHEYALMRHYVSGAAKGGDRDDLAQRLVPQFNLNIPCGQSIKSTKKKPASLSARSAVSEVLRRSKPQNRDVVRRKLSEGIKDIAELAGILRETEFHPEMRDEMLMNIGSSTRTLSDLFHKTPEALFRHLHGEARQVQKHQFDLSGNFHACAFVFRPQAYKQMFWKRERDSWKAPAILIHGSFDEVLSKTGKRYYKPQIRLHFDNARVGYDFEREFNLQGKAHSSNPAFLVYSERAYVDLPRFEYDVDAIRAGKLKDTGVFVDVHVANKAQYTPWKDVDPQGQLLLETA